MYHYAKSGKRKGKRNRLLAACFVLCGLWAAELIYLAAEQGLLPAVQSPMVKLVYHGAQLDVPVAGQTAGKALQSLGLALTQQDVVSVPLDAVLSPGERFTVELRQTRQEVYTMAIPPETEYCADNALPWGQEAVLVPGVPGEMRCTAWVDYVNGRETRREVTDRQLLYPAQNEIVAVGTCEHPTVSARSGYLWLPEGQMLTYTHTATVEATGFTDADAGAIPNACPGTVAVDPAFIPPGTRLYLVSADGFLLYGTARAGNGMQGSRVDLYFPNAAESAQFGRQQCTVYFLG